MPIEEEEPDDVGVDEEKSGVGNDVEEEEPDDVGA